MAKNSQLAALNEIGQSVWYDNLSKDVLNSGQLAKYIEQGVSGLTSNPTIFDKSISGSALYDDEMKKLAKQGATAAQICEELMIQDVGQAADLLLPVYKSSNGGDGYASIEVSPLLARETKSTIDEARRLWSKLNRPNVMIKVPATTEGIPAIKQLLSDGLNVNVTLIFSDQVYREVAGAYIEALESRAKNNQPIDKISSVASFFVSRVDAICEKKLDQISSSKNLSAAQRKEFEGKVGIANCKVAYASFHELFEGARFQPLKAKGARVQRPLWASTGTKNPAFSPVLYVEELAGRDTVNTMPPQTLEALLKQANIKPKLHDGLSGARKLVADLDAWGVDFDAALVELQTQGVELFAQSYNSLLQSVETKRKQFAI